MTMADRSIAMGVFEDSTLAQQAIDELRQAGFGDDHIGFAVRKDPLVESGASAPRTEKQYVVVMVRAEDRQQQALDILRRCGASHAGMRSDLLDETNATSSSREYDSITGPQPAASDEVQWIWPRT